MIVTTMNDIPGYTVDEVFGEVMGLDQSDRGTSARRSAPVSSRSSAAS